MEEQYYSIEEGIFGLEVHKIGIKKRGWTNIVRLLKKTLSDLVKVLCSWFVWWRFGDLRGFNKLKNIEFVSYIE